MCWAYRPELCCEGGVRGKDGQGVAEAAILPPQSSLLQALTGLLGAETRQEGKVMTEEELGPCGLGTVGIVSALEVVTSF